MNCLRFPNRSFTDFNKEHTYLVTETGVEVLTARTESSPGGAIPMPAVENGANGGS